MKTKGKKGIRKLTALVLLTAMILSLLPNVTLFSWNHAKAATGDVPAHNKTIHDNENGTYTLSLDVTGDSEKKPAKVNIIVIVDRSGSMNDPAGPGTYGTRLEATKSAINGLASSLLSYNGKDGNPADTVQMALVSFATTAQTNVSGTTEVGTYATAVNGLDADGGRPP